MFLPFSYFNNKNLIIFIATLLFPTDNIYYYYYYLYVRVRILFSSVLTTQLVTSKSV